MDTHEAHARGRAEFEQRLRQITDADWDRTTPCDGWTVRDLVHHVVGGNRMTVVVLEGGSAEDASAMFGRTELSGDPIADFVSAADAVDAAFRAPGVLDQTVHHPAGDMPATQLHGFRIGDSTLHAWDLARAIDADDALDPELVAAVWEAVAPMEPFIGQLGMFGEGPSGTVGEDAPLQDRLVDLTGRRG